MLRRIVLSFGILLCGLFAGSAVAQTDQQQEDLTGKNIGWEVGGHVGKLLPNQITGVSEIMSLAGVRGGFRVSSDAFADFAFSSGNGSGAHWKNLSASMRMDMPIEMLVGIAYLGLDASYYKGSHTSDNKLIFGGHAGGGVMSLLGGSTWFRADMKFSFSPGTSLFIGFGFVFRFPGGGAGGA